MELCDSLRPGFARKVRVWAAGGETKAMPDKEYLRENCLIYKKNIKAGILPQIFSVLRSKNLKFEVINYGHYKQADYYEKLLRAKFLIFLSVSESQGIALHEAWMHNVATLVYNGEHWALGKQQWASSSPAPYLNKQSGMFFIAETFRSQLEIFLSKLQNFAPRQQHLENFTDKVSAQKFLEIVSAIKE